LIFYVRPDSVEPAESRYSLVAVPDPSALIAVLSRALGVKAVVRKVRALYHAGGTRIAYGLMDRLGIGSEDLVEVAYADLLIS